MKGNFPAYPKDSLETPKLLLQSIVRFGTCSFGFAKGKPSIASMLISYGADEMAPDKELGIPDNSILAASGEPAPTRIL